MRQVSDRTPGGQLPRNPLSGRHACCRVMHRRRQSRPIAIRTFCRAEAMRTFIVAGISFQWTDVRGPASTLLQSSQGSTSAKPTIVDRVPRDAGDQTIVPGTLSTCPRRRRRRGSSRTSCSARTTILAAELRRLAQAPEAEKRSSPDVKKYETRGVRRIERPCVRAVRQSRANRGLRACLAGASARHVDNLSLNPNHTRHARRGFGRLDWGSHRGSRRASLVRDTPEPARPAQRRERSSGPARG